MALTEEQEAKLLQLLSAYENGKRVGDLPEVTTGKDSAGLMVEVVDTDGESKKFDLGNVAPVLNITSFGSEQPYGTRRLRRVDRKGNPVWSDRNDPNGYWLSPEEYDGECDPVLDEDGNQIVGANGKPLYADATLGVELIQETRAVSAFVAWADFDVSRLKIGLRVSIKDLEGATDSNWSVSEIGEKGFTVRNGNGETSQFFYEGEFWVGKGTDGIEEGSHIMTMAIGYGHNYFLGGVDRIPEYNYPYGNDIHSGGRYTFDLDSNLFGVDTPRGFTGFATDVSESSAGFEGFDDYEGLRVQLQLTKGEDGFWHLSDPDFNETMFIRTRPDYFYAHMCTLGDAVPICSMVDEYTDDLGQVVRGLVNPALSGGSLYETISQLKGWVSRTRFAISVMDSSQSVFTEDFSLIPIQGGALDAIAYGYYGAIAIEFYLIAPNCQMYFVRLAYDSENNIIEEESIIPDGVY